MSRPKHIKETRFEFLKRSAEEHEASDTREACLIWPFGKVEGYGILQWNPIPEYPRVRVPERAHRVAYFLHYGELPNPCGLHTCDDVSCYNWRHIYPGDDMRNAADRVARGLAHGPRGEDNPSSKLTPELVLQMRRESAYTPQKELCEKYKMSRHGVRRVLTGKLWKHVEMPPETRHHYKDAFGINDGSKKLTEDDVRHIRTSNLSIKELSALYRVSRITIGRIVRRVRWTHVE